MPCERCKNTGSIPRFLFFGRKDCPDCTDDRLAQLDLLIRLALRENPHLLSGAAASKVDCEQN